MTTNPGEIWLADIPFTDRKASKIRPVLVLWLDGLDSIVAVVTSAGPRNLTDVPLTDWKASGLRKPSTVRLSHIDCLESSLLFHRTGVLTAADAQRVKDAWDHHVKPSF